MSTESSRRPASKGVKSSCVAGSADGDLATDAATHLGRGGYTFESLSGSSEEIDKQAACLVEWAEQQKALLTEAHFDGLKKHTAGTTAEHEIFYRQSDSRVVKRTYPGTFGVTPEPKGVQKAATPAFYLERMRLMNEFFDSDFRLEGITFGKSLILFATGEKPCIVVSQPWIRPADPQNPHPTKAEIKEFMELAGFKEDVTSYYGWCNEVEGISVIDARPDNFILSRVGVVPIDLVIFKSKPRSSSIIIT